MDEASGEAATSVRSYEVIQIGLDLRVDVIFNDIPLQ